MIVTGYSEMFERILFIVIFSHLKTNVWTWNVYTGPNEFTKSLVFGGIQVRSYGVPGDVLIQLDYAKKKVMFVNFRNREHSMKIDDSSAQWRELVNIWRQFLWSGKNLLRFRDFTKEMGG